MLTKQPRYFFSYVYMIYKPAGTDPYVKIGCTDNPIQRMSNLQQGNADELDYALIIKVPDEKKFEAEKAAQEYFITQNLRTKPILKGGKEWFNISTIGRQAAVEKIVENLKNKHFYIADETNNFKK